MTPAHRLKNVFAISRPGFTKTLVAFAAVLFAIAGGSPAAAQRTPDFSSIRAEVQFDRVLRVWDGFGVNYVEEAQTRDPNEFRQEYGGFHLLDRASRHEIIELVFGEDGLKPGVVKMFLDPWHQAEPGGPYNHESTTEYMRYFVRKGLETTRARGDDLEIITTLYGPPAYMTLQKQIRGRDFDHRHKQDFADYAASWVRFLREKEGFPVKHFSLHNEGEDWERWPLSGEDAPEHPRRSHLRHDYNMYWSPELVVEFLELLPGEFRKAGLDGVGVTPGEPYGWDRLSDAGFAKAIADSDKAISGMTLITSHGFNRWRNFDRWHVYLTSRPVDILREKRPELHAWTTSASWKDMDALFVREIHELIYHVKTNAFIPWAAIQRPGKWVGGDPNPGCAILVHDDGTYEITKGYYFYKQVTRPGQPGTGIAYTISIDPEVRIIGFAPRDTGNPAAFVVINNNPNNDKPLSIALSGSTATAFEAYRTTNDQSDQYSSAGTFRVADNRLTYTAPAGSVTTFYGNR